MSTFKVKTSELRKLVDPLDGNMWKCGPIAEDEIESARQQKTFDNRSWSDEVIQLNLSLEDARSFHINRIATILENEPSGLIAMVIMNDTAEVTAYISDGNHTLAATYIRGDDEIELVITAYNPNDINYLLPSATLVQVNA